MKSVRVGKAWQAFLLGSTTCVILALTLLVEGRRPVGTNLAPFEDVGKLLLHSRRGDLFSGRFLLGALGIVGNLFLFVPWGFLTWKFLDGSGRSAFRIHLEVIFFGVLLSAGIELSQLFLPTRAADVDDVIWNVLGTAAGGVLAHLGRQVRLEWE
jgi:glycopeptide antibiotics resistance protein